LASLISINRVGVSAARPGGLVAASRAGRGGRPGFTSRWSSLKA